MKVIGEMLEMVGASNDFSPLVSSQIIKGSQASIPQLQRYNGGGLANLNYNLDFDINDYLENILGVDTGEGTEEDMATALARAYGAPSEGIGLTLDQWVTEIQHLALASALMLRM